MVSITKTPSDYGGFSQNYEYLSGIHMTVAMDYDCSYVSANMRNQYETK